jgi:hypothetical protein
MSRRAAAAPLTALRAPQGCNEGWDLRVPASNALIETLADLPARLLGASSALDSLAQPV